MTSIKNRQMREQLDREERYIKMCPGWYIKAGPEDQEDKEDLRYTSIEDAVRDYERDHEEEQTK